MTHFSLYEQMPYEDILECRTVSQQSRPNSQRFLPVNHKTTNVSLSFRSYEALHLCVIIRGGK